MLVIQWLTDKQKKAMFDALEKVKSGKQDKFYCDSFHFVNMLPIGFNFRCVSLVKRFEHFLSMSFLQS